jgi:hypothetical protein
VPQPGSAADLQSTYNERSTFYGDAISTMDQLVDVRDGNLPDEFMQYFHEEMHPHVVNSIRRSHDDMTAMASKVFPVYFPPDNQSPTSKARAERQERICYAYQDMGRYRGSLDSHQLSYVTNWWLVLCANAVQMVLPDYDRKMPFFHWRDPRTHLPPVGWTPYSEAPLNDTMFVYMDTVAHLKQKYPGSAQALGNRYSKSHALTTGWKSGGSSRSSAGGDDQTIVMVAEWYSDQTWMFATIEDRPLVLWEAAEGDKKFPGLCPVGHLSLYDPSSSQARSWLADQVSMQAAISRMFSQKLDGYDRMLWPPFFHTPLTHPNVR